MKKLNLIFLFTLTLFIASCDSDDSSGVDIDPVMASTDILGDWNLVELETTNGRVESNALGLEINANFTAVGQDFDTLVTFSGDPQMVTSSGSYTTVITTEIAGVTETEEVPGEDFFETSTWRIENNQLIFSDDGVDVPFDITEFSENRLSLRVDIDETESELGFTSSVSATYTMTLTR
ncbi:lipocalin family protein [Spongiimicrobium salis]|uniref:lipocalin family protein n=1 Tax=Spongiimicrobium salis TaxID=1667022 RepID=UPI00374DCB48